MLWASAPAIRRPRWLHDRGKQSRAPSGEGAQAGGPRPRIPDTAWAAAAHLLLTVALLHAAWSHPQTRWAGGCCDPEQSMWFLRWIPYVLGHPQNPFFTHHLNAPYGVNLMWNTAQQLPALILTPVTLAFGVITAYTTLVTLAFALAGLSSFIVLRRWCKGFLGPLAGSLLYEFSPYMVGQSLGHSNLILVASAPLFLLLLDTVINRPERSARRAGLAIGLLATAQLLSSEEILATEAIAGLVLAAALVALGQPLIRSRLSRILEAGAWAGGVFAVTAGYPLFEQVAGPQRVSGPLQNSDLWTTDLLNLITPTSAQWIAPASAIRTSATFDSGFTLEASGYIGIPLILLLVWVVFRYRRCLAVRTAAATTALLVILSLGPVLRVGGQSTGLGLPWGLVHHLRFLEDILPGRLMVYAFLGVAVLFAVFVDRALSDTRRLARNTSLVAGVLAVVPLLPAPNFPATQVAIPRLFKHWSDAGVAESSDDVLLAPFIRDGGSADPMLWQATAGLRFKMPQGYFYIPTRSGTAQYGALPSTLSQVMESVQDKGVVVKVEGPVYQALIHDLRVRRVRAVVVGPMAHRELMVKTFTLLLGRAPLALDGVQIWRLPGVAKLRQRSSGRLPGRAG